MNVPKCSKLIGSVVLAVKIRRRITSESFGWKVPNLLEKVATFKQLMELFLLHSPFNYQSTVLSKQNGSGKRFVDLSHVFSIIDKMQHYFFVFSNCNVFPLTINFDITQTRSLLLNVSSFYSIRQKVDIFLILFVE